MNVSSISNLLSYDIVVTIVVASTILLLVWFILCGKNNKNKEHDKELFKQPPPADDCPICFLRLPYLGSGRIYYSCCGKVICSGCMYAPVYDDQGNKVDNQKCPYCRTPHPTTEEELQRRYNKRVEVGDTLAMHNLGMFYSEGLNGYTQDYTKALEYWHEAGELGDARAHGNIGVAYKHGEGVEVNEKKATYYYEQAAMKGAVDARFNLGNIEYRLGNFDRAVKHYMIAISSGDNDSLETIQKLYSKGYATKEEYRKALQLYQQYLGEIKSRQRDEAAAANERYRYY